MWPITGSIVWSVVAPLPLSDTENRRTQLRAQGMFMASIKWSTEEGGAPCAPAFANGLPLMVQQNRPPFPVSYDQREALKGRGLLPHIVAWYARSMECRKYDVKEHVFTELSLAAYCGRQNFLSAASPIFLITRPTSYGL